MIKSLKNTLYKNFSSLLRKPTGDADQFTEGINKSNKSNQLKKKSSRLKQLHPDARTKVESIGIVISDYQIPLYTDMMKSKDFSIKANDIQVENILLKQILCTLAIKQFKNLQTHTIIVTVYTI
jgi:hypothetical protein